MKKKVLVKTKRIAEREINIPQKKKKKESSPTPQFKSINSSVLSFVYIPALTYIHDHWKNQSPN